MSRLVSVGRFFFTVAFIGLGIEHFIFQDFITGRAPAWPELIPGKLIWAYLTGIIFIGISLAMLFQKKARHAAILAGTLIFLWALVRHIPVIASDSFLSGAWTGAGKALTFFGGAFAIAGTLPQEASNRSNSVLKFVNRSDEFFLLGRICLGIFLLITGIQHFFLPNSWPP